MTIDKSAASERLETLLRELITEQSCGEWDDKTIEADVQKFLPHILALIDTPAPPAEPAGDADLSDYDAGLLNDYGGGNVDWWQDYLRAEIGRANDHWRDQVSALVAAPAPDALKPSNDQCPEPRSHSRRD